MLKNYLLICFFLGNALLCLSNMDAWHNGWLAPSFLANLVCILIGFHQSLRGTDLNLDTIVWVFVYMFFFLAPVIQMGNGTVFPNTMPIDPADVLQANFAILLWNFVYLIFRKSAVRPKLPDMPEPFSGGRRNKEPLGLAGPGVRQIYFGLALLVFAGTFAKFKLPFFLGYVDYSAAGLDKSLALICTIGAQGIVFANWLFAFDRRRERPGLKQTAYFAVSTVMFLYQISPFNTSRFYLGFVVILIVYLYYRHSMTPGKFVWLILSGLFFVFPLLNFFRYGFKGIEIPSPYHLMFDQLTELHFDAFSNLIATFHYARDFGYAYGYRLLGVVLFFVPRGIWAGKPLSSGEAIGDYVSAKYSLNMNNLSNPLPSEFFMNFGWLGVLLGAAAAAAFINKLEAAGGRSRYVHALIAGYLFIIYRGDLMNAFAYCFGTYVIMVRGPAVLAKLAKRPAAAVIRGERQWPSW